jgi:F-type H+-transporting ATPase subunit epsilon
MPKTPFELSVVTPEKTVINMNVVSVTVPSSDGYIGIWANHAPLMTSMRIGCLEYITEGGVREVLAVSNGFVEVADNKVVVLADSVEQQHEINVERAKLARERARENLAAGRTNIDIDRARESYERAINRLDVAQKK